MVDFRIGTSAFTAAGWEGSFYPVGMDASENILAINPPCRASSSFLRGAEE